VNQDDMFCPGVGKILAMSARTHVDLLGAVIKPIYGAASIGVVRVNDMPQLEQAYKRVTRELAKAHIVAGALQQGEEEDEDSAADQAIDATVSQVSLHVLTPMDAVSTNSTLRKMLFVCSSKECP
jgi:carbamoylphosphate synthase large subunit